MLTKNISIAMLYTTRDNYVLYLEKPPPYTFSRHVITVITDNLPNIPKSVTLQYQLANRGHGTQVLCE